MFYGKLHAIEYFEINGNPGIFGKNVLQQIIRGKFTVDEALQGITALFDRINSIAMTIYRNVNNKTGTALLPMVTIKHDLAARCRLRSIGGTQQRGTAHRVD